MCSPFLTVAGLVGLLSAQAPDGQPLSDQPLSVVLECLQSSEQRDPEAALLELRRRGPAAGSAVTLVATMAADGHRLQWYMIRTLQKLGPEAVGPMVRLLLSDLQTIDDHDRRILAIQLSKFGSPAVVPLLEGIAGYGEVSERKGYIDRSSALRWLHRAVVEMDTEAIPGLLGGLKSPVDEVRYLSTTYLSRFGKAAEQAKEDLIEIARKDSSHRVRVMAATAVRRIDPSIPATDLLVRSEAKEIENETIAFLVHEIEDPNPNIRRAVIRELDSMGQRGEALAEDLRRIAIDKQNALRLLAIQALGNMGLRGAKTLQRIFVESDEPDIEQATFEAMLQSDPYGVRELVRSTAPPSWLDVETLILEDAPFSVMPWTLQEGGDWLRLRDAGLSKFDASKHALREGQSEFLLDCLEDDHFGARVYALTVLRRGKGSPDTLSTLIAYRDASVTPSERWPFEEALFVLDPYGGIDQDPNKLATLRRRLFEGPMSRRVLAMRLLPSLGEDARQLVPDLMKIIEGRTKRSFHPVQIEPKVVDTLGDLGAIAEEALPLLHAVARNRDDPIMAKRAQRAIAKIENGLEVQPRTSTDAKKLRLE